MKRIIFVLGILVAFAVSLNAQVISAVEYGADSPMPNLVSDDLNDTICVNDPVVFSTAFESGTNFTFEVDGFVVQGPGISSTYVNAGTLTVGSHDIVVLADNGSCIVTDTIYGFEVLALPAPTLISDAVGNELCDGDAVTFTATGGVNYDFRVNSVSVQSGAADTYLTSSLIDGDVVDVIVTNAGSCSTTSASLTMTVHALPTPTLVSDAVGDEACDGTDVTFTATGGVNYDFRVNSVSVQSGAADTYLTSSLVDGDVVDVIVTNANGCVATSTSITITIHSLPSITDIVYGSAYSVATAECVSTMVNVELQGMTGASPYTVRIFDDAGGPGSLFYTVPGTVAGPNGNIVKPIYGTGTNVQYYQIEDQNGCFNFPTP